MPTDTAIYSLDNKTMQLYMELLDPHLSINDVLNVTAYAVMGCGKEYSVNIYAKLLPEANFAIFRSLYCSVFFHLIKARRLKEITFLDVHFHKHSLVKCITFLSKLTSCVLVGLILNTLVLITAGRKSRMVTVR
jgi:hypothetical protein